LLASNQVGMNIKGANRNGTISTSEVIFNPHPYNTGTHYFDEVVTVNGKRVRMTRNHLVPTCNGGLVTARSLQPGDCVMTVDGEEKVAKTTQNVEAGSSWWTASWRRPSRSPTASRTPSSTART
jgi:N-acyl-D-aspartate/D-glutamate deacylase